MAYTLIKKLVPASKYPTKCPYVMTPTGIVIHNTANNASARNEISYMTTNSLERSFHYAIDHIEVVQGIPTNRNSWQAGDGASGTGNRKKISIEICYSLSGGSKFDGAERNAAAFTAKLLKSKGWGVSRVSKHQDYSGKYCPHRTLDRGWNGFIILVEAELKKLTPAPPPPPAVPKITYKKVVKTVVLTRDAKLWDFDFDTWATAKPVADYSQGDIVEVVAMATNKLNAKYYMTSFSYDGGRIKRTWGFNVADTKDFVPPPPIVEPPIPVPPPPLPEPTPPIPPEPPVEPPVDPPEEIPNWFVNFIKKLIDFLNPWANKEK